MKKILIVGGGIAGISAGIYAQNAGYDSVIYEKNPVAGGQCMGWNRNSHHIDNCIHWLTGTKKGTGLYQLWETVGALGNGTAYVDNRQFYSSTLNGQTATLWKDLNRTQQELLQLSPEDAEAIRKFIRDVRLAECCEMPVSKPMDMMNPVDYIHMGASMKDMAAISKEYDRISIEDLGNRFQHPLLRRLITDYMPKEYAAMSFIVSYATVTSGNGNIPRNGSLAMVNRMIQTYQAAGGILHCNSPVSKIIVEKNKALGLLLSDGSQVNGDYIISAADTAETFYRLTDISHMDKHLKRLYDNRADYPVFSGLQMAFSIDSNLIDADTLFFDCKPFKVNQKEVNRISIKTYEYEPSFAPEGKTVLQVNIPQREEDFAYWRSLDREKYISEKQKISDLVAGSLCEKFPMLKDSLRLLDCWTPLTYQRYCNSYHGSYMAFIKTNHVKIPTIKGTVKGVPNLFIASQWLMSPGGLPVAAATGKFAIQRILKKEKRSINI